MSVDVDKSSRLLLSSSYFKDANIPHRPGKSLNCAAKTFLKPILLNAQKFARIKIILINSLTDKQRAIELTRTRA